MQDISLSHTFSALKQQRRKGLITFITAGDPDPGSTVALMHAQVAGGADILELGMPFSDPMAEGPIIQRASERALAHGVNISDVLHYVSEFRKSNRKTPVVLMGYANPIERMGVDIFVQQAVHAGVNAVLVVDYPPEASLALQHALQAYQLDMIFLLAPTSQPQRITEIAQQARGFIYYVSLRGVTGTGEIALAEIRKRLAEIRKQTSLPIAVGFGIRDTHTAQAVAACAEAVVVGSYLIEAMENLPVAQAPAVLQARVADLRAALDAVSGL